MSGAIQTLSNLSGGQTMIDLDKELDKAVAKAFETGMNASVTLTLTVKPHGDTMKVADKITTKLPNRARVETLFYRGRDNKLSREDPKQIPMFGDRERQQPETVAHEDVN